MNSIFSKKNKVFIASVIFLSLLINLSTALLSFPRLRTTYLSRPKIAGLKSRVRLRKMREARRRLINANHEIIDTPPPLGLYGTTTIILSSLALALREAYYESKATKDNVR